MVTQLYCKQALPETVNSATHMPDVYATIYGSVDSKIKKYIIY